MLSKLNPTSQENPISIGYIDFIGSWKCFWNSAHEIVFCIFGRGRPKLLSKFSPNNQNKSHTRAITVINVDPRCYNIITK